MPMPITYFGVKLLGNVLAAVNTNNQAISAITAGNDTIVCRAVSVQLHSCYSSVVAK